MPLLVFQISAIVILSVTVVLLSRGGGAKQQALRRIFMLLFLLVFGFALFFPEVWTSVANFFGIGRGTDLLLYSTVFVFLLFIVSVFRKFRTQERQITKLARKIALLEAQLEGKSN